MVDLDNRAELQKLDQSNMISSIELLDKQCQEVWRQGEKLNLPKSYARVKNIVVAGLGGSALGAQVIDAVFSRELTVPLDIVNDYHLPGYVDENTLVVLSSYSGSTEEVLNAAAEATKAKAKSLIIASGGELAKIAKQKKIPALIFNPISNPSGSPRMGLGYSIFGQISLLKKSGLLSLAEADVDKTVQVIQKYQQIFGVDSPAQNNQAKKLAKDLLNRAVFYVGAEHLVGSAHVAANQFNENAKVFGSFFAMPELNHHLLEGLRFPATNKENLFFILVESNLYDKRVQKRFAILKEILKRQEITYSSYELKEKTKLSQACEMLVFGSCVSFYLAMLEGIDPTPIPQVDYFKEAMRS